MEMHTIDNITIIKSESNITEISAPEYVSLDLSKYLSKDFQSDVTGVIEHYVAVAKNYNDEEILNKAIELFNQKDSIQD